MNEQIQFQMSDFYDNVVYPIEQEQYDPEGGSFGEGGWHYWFVCQCGQRIRPNQNFCDNCGGRIDWKNIKRLDT